MGGHILGRLWPRNDNERIKAKEQGYDVNKMLTTDDLCKGKQVSLSDLFCFTKHEYLPRGMAEQSMRIDV